MGTPQSTTEAPTEVGVRLRELRRQQGLSARAVAAAVGISPSAVSQIERGVLQPSIARLIAITDALGVPLAEVFEERTERIAPASGGVFALQRAHESQSIPLETGVVFRRLSPGRMPGVDYFESVYPPGASATTEGSLFRHEGYEVGRMLAGELTIDFDDERVVLHPGDAISYPCSRPHHIHNTGEVDAVAQWVIVHTPQ
ncbi:MAG: helix-turn-helix domain-containing protein [Microbacterium sp.]